MKLFALVVGCLLSGVLFGLSNGTRSKPQRVRVNVLRVLDGDTVDVEDQNGKKIRVRLIYIDAPEKAQPFGRDSKQFLENFIEWKQLELVAYNTDVYGRTLGELYIPEININQAMVHSGFAWCYRNKCPRSYRNKFKQAQEARVGLWLGDKPQAPWIYRKKNVTKADDVIAAIPKKSNSKKGKKLMEVEFGWVADGDSLTVYNKETNEKMKIRLNYIDAPELSQEGGQASKQFLVDLIQDHYVDKLGASHQPKLYVRIYGKDQYRRYLGVLHINETDANEMMVKLGHAWCYKAGCLGGYLKALKRARKSKIGLWAKKNPQAPWIYRAERRNRHRKQKKQ